MRSFFPGFLASARVGLSFARVSFFLFSSLNRTWVAASNFLPNASPIALKGFSFLQQTRMVQDPDTPWHLQTSSMLVLMIWKPREPKHEDDCWIMTWHATDPPTSFIVVEVHESRWSIFFLWRIYKISWKLGSVPNVIWTSSPLPSAFCVFVPDPLVAPTFGNLPQATRFGNAVCDSGSGNGVNVGFFSALFGKRREELRRDGHWASWWLTDISHASEYSRTVIKCSAVPSVSLELMLTLVDAHFGPPTDDLKNVMIQIADLLLLPDEIIKLSAGSLVVGRFEFEGTLVSSRHPQKPIEPKIEFRSQSIKRGRNKESELASLGSNDGILFRERICCDRFYDFRSWNPLLVKVNDARIKEWNNPRRAMRRINLIAYKTSLLASFCPFKHCHWIPVLLEPTQFYFFPLWPTMVVMMQEKDVCSDPFSLPHTVSRSTPAQLIP